MLPPSTPHPASPSCRAASACYPQWVSPPSTEMTLPVIQ